MACVNSVLAVLERIVYSRKLRSICVDPPPLFVLGHWRSGTTLLHTWLARDPQFVAPTVFQTWFPEHFLVSEGWLPALTQWLLPPSRPMDNMPFRWDAPGEDEMALLLLTLYSPYLVAAFPDDPDKVRRFDNLQRGLSSEDLEHWKDSLQRFIRKLMLKRRGRLLLKSPTHTARIPLLLQMFPDARFVYIVRHPYDVFASTRHLHEVLCRENSFVCPPLIGLEERILTSYSEMYQAYHLQRAMIDPGRRCELRYEDLIADPPGQLQRIYEHLGLDGGEQLSTRLAGELAAHRTYRTNRYTLDENVRRRIAEEWGPTFRRYGYPV